MEELDGTPAVVIGAGPYGLAIAAHLRARGVPVRVFGDPMDSWRRQMPPGMFLKSTPRASSLSAPDPGHTLADYCRQHDVGPLGPDEPVPIELFIRYGRWFQQELVPDVERAWVQRVRHHDGGLDVTLDTGEELRTGAVIVASGLFGFAHVPRQLAALPGGTSGPPGVVSHSSRYGDLSGFAGSDVIVVGAGQSALETAVLAHESGARVQVLARGRVSFAHAPAADGARRPTVLRPPSPLGPGWRHVAVSSLPASFRLLPAPVRLSLVKRILGPSGAWWLRERFSCDAIGVHTGRHLVDATLDGARVVLTVSDAPGGRTSTLDADHVIAATGYRVDLEKLAFIEAGTRARLARVGGSPRLDAAFESTVPGLFFPGLAAAATFGPVQRFVCGTRFAAERVTGAVAGRARQFALR